MDPNQQQGQRHHSLGTGLIKTAGMLSIYSFMGQFGGNFGIPLGMGKMGFSTKAASWTGITGLRTLAMGESAHHANSMVLSGLRAIGGDNLRKHGLLGKIAPGVAKVLGGSGRAFLGSEGLKNAFLSGKKGFRASKVFAEVINPLSDEYSSIGWKKWTFRPGKIEQEVSEKIENMIRKKYAKDPAMINKILQGFKSADKSGLKSFAMRSAATRGLMAVNTITNAYMAYKVGSWAVRTTVRAMGGAFMNSIRALNAFNRLDFNVGAPDVGNVAPYMTGGAATERQRALQFMQQSSGVMQQLGARASVFGNEAEYAHWGG